jgi:hypothetical protein
MIAQAPASWLSGSGGAVVCEHTPVSLRQLRLTRRAKTAVSQGDNLSSVGIFSAGITDLFAGRSAPPHGRASAALALGLRGVTLRRSEIR